MVEANGPCAVKVLLASANEGEVDEESPAKADGCILRRLSWVVREQSLIVQDDDGLLDGQRRCAIEISTSGDLRNWNQTQELNDRRIV